MYTIVGWFSWEVELSFVEPAFYFLREWTSESLDMPLVKKLPHSIDKELNAYTLLIA